MIKMGGMELDVPDEIEKEFKAKALIVYKGEDNPVDKAAKIAINEWTEKIHSQR